MTPAAAPGYRSRVRRSAKDKVRIVYEPLSSLVRWPKNPKRHDLDGIGSSIDRFGYVMPIAVDERTGRIFAGHGRLETLELRKQTGGEPPLRVKIDRASGEWLVPVLRGIEFSSPDEAEAYVVADNQLTVAGGFDDVLLRELLQRHDAAQLPVTGLGFDDTELERLLHAADSPPGGEGPGGPGGQPIIPNPEPQREPQIASEAFVEVFCTRADLEEFRRTLDEWAKRPGVTVNISSS